MCGIWAVTANLLPFSPLCCSNYWIYTGYILVVGQFSQRNWDSFHKGTGTVFTRITHLLHSSQVGLNYPDGRRAIFEHEPAAYTFNFSFRVNC